MSDEGLFEPGVFAMMTDYLAKAQGSPTRALRLAVGDLIARERKPVDASVVDGASIAWCDAEGRVMAAEWVPGTVVGVGQLHEDIVRIIEREFARHAPCAEGNADV